MLQIDFLKELTVPSPTSSIAIDARQQTFVINLRSSYYALRVLDDGHVVHVGSGPSAGPMALSHLDQYGDADYVWDGQGRNWEIPAFGDVSYHHAAIKVAFPEPPPSMAAGDAPNLPVRDLRLRFERHEIRTDATPAYAPAHGRVPPKAAVSRETLVLHLQDKEYDFRCRLFYRVTPEHDIIERWIEVENNTDRAVTVEALAFGTLNFPPGAYELTRAAGAWARELATVRQALEQGETVLRHQGLNTGHAVNPFFLLNERGKATEDAGVVRFGALAFSGNWYLQFESLLTDALRVHGGYEPDGFELILQPGEIHTTPAFVHGSAADGYGGASRRLHGFARDYVLPSAYDAYAQEGGFRPVLYNGWEASYFDLSIDGQIKLARLAAEIGVEMFCVDDGWFGGRRHDRAGLGDWTVSADVFPTGLTPLINEVKRLGMRFGLWVEPEMVNPDSDLYRAHPDWALHYPGRPRTEMRQQLILDFGRPEVVAYILDALEALVTEYDISFFKWDMNRYVSEPGSVAGQAIWRKHVEGVYHIMDTLRRNHPGLEIESCSGGGGRIDLGIMARTDQFWTSDNTDAYDRVTIQDGCSLAYPTRAMMCWVTHEHNHQTGRHASLDFRFDVAMRGGLGIGASLNDLSADELAIYRRKIAFYKTIRPIVQGGDLYRLATVSDLSASTFSVWQSVLPDRSQSVYSSVVVHQLLGHYIPTLPLRGLDPEATYAATDDAGKELGRYSGSQLMTLGLPGDQRFGGLGASTRSRTVLLTRI